jgi:hypothetical protein
MTDLKDILGNSNKDIDNQRLMDYLSGRLTDAEQHELEAGMDDEMMSDALEGLQSVKGTHNLDLTVFELNQKLKKELKIKEKKKNRRKIKDFELTVIAIVVILVLCVLAFIVIRMKGKG